MGVREVPVPEPCASASVSQTWHEAGELLQTPAAAKCSWEHLECCPLATASPAWQPSVPTPSSLPGCCPQPGSMPGKAMPTMLGSASILTGTVTLLSPGTGLGLDGVSQHPCGVSQLTDSLPALLLDSPSGRALFASQSWAVTRVRSRFPGTGICGSSRLHGFEPP